MLKQLADFYDISIVDLYIKAGYLTYEALNICPQVFHGIDKLTEDEQKHNTGQLITISNQSSIERKPL